MSWYTLLYEKGKSIIFCVIGEIKTYTEICNFSKKNVKKQLLRLVTYREWVGFRIKWMVNQWYSYEYNLYNFNFGTMLHFYKIKAMNEMG